MTEEGLSLPFGRVETNSKRNESILQRNAYHIVLLLVVLERTRMTQRVAQVDSGRNADDSACGTPSEVPMLIFGQGEKLSALSEPGSAPGR